MQQSQLSLSRPARRRVGRRSDRNSHRNFAARSRRSGSDWARSLRLRASARVLIKRGLAASGLRGDDESLKNVSGISVPL
jgi:hypothetical protein